MRFMRLRTGQGRILPCLVDEAGEVRDASALIPDVGPDTLGTDLFDRLAAADVRALPAVPQGQLALAPPIARPRTIWCIGLNYADHALEAGLPIPYEPILFNKSGATFCGPDDPILFAGSMTKLDWEVELGVVIGAPAFGVSPHKALAHVAGYVVVNDLSERAWQMERGGQWVKGKSFPNFCPTGPVLVTPDEVPDVQNLDMWLDVNGQRMQRGSTSSMIFSVATIVSYLSGFTRLEAGDLICTGTPPGVGAGMIPPRWLAPGDVVTLGIAGLGVQRQVVRKIEDVE